MSLIAEESVATMAINGEGPAGQSPLSQTIGDGLREIADAVREHGAES